MERRLTVLLNENGSVEIVPEDGSSKENIWISGVFLILEFCFGVGLCLIALLGVRTKYCPKAVIGLLIAAMLDCIQGPVMGTIFLIIHPDLYMCRLSACTSTVMLIIETAEVALLTYTSPGFQVDIIPWIVGIIMGFYIVVDYHHIPINFYPSRYACSVIGGGHEWFYMFLIMIFGTSWLGTAIGLTHSAIFKETDVDIIVTRIITVLYIILLLPLTMILLISASNKPYLSQNNLISNKMNTFVTERVFTWARYQFNLLIPIIILIFYKEVRKRSENLLCWCKKNNSVRDISIRNKNFNNSLRNCRNTRKRVSNNFQELKSKPTTPVLFATSHGLHLRVIDSNDFPSTSRRSKETSVICEPCDLTQSDISTPKAVTLKPPNILNDYRKNVRFASPPSVLRNVALNESGVWSNTEEIEALHFNSIRTSQHETKTLRELGVTYTKV